MVFGDYVRARMAARALPRTPTTRETEETEEKEEEKKTNEGPPPHATAIPQPTTHHTETHTPQHIKS